MSSSCLWGLPADLWFQCLHASGDAGGGALLRGEGETGQAAQKSLSQSVLILRLGEDL